MGTFIAIVLAAVLTNNFITVKTYGICPFLGVSKKTSSAAGMGIAVTLVMIIATLVTYPIYTYVMVPLKIEFLEIIFFIFIIASLVQMLEKIIQKLSPSLYGAMGIYLPLITTNCAVLGTANSVISQGLDFFQTLITGISIGVGFTVALILMAGIREKQTLYDVPRPFAGFPIALVTAGIMAMAFYGFMGLSFT